MAHVNYSTAMYASVAFQQILVEEAVVELPANVKASAATGHPAKNSAGGMHISFEP